MSKHVEICRNMSKSNFATDGAPYHGTHRYFILGTTMVDIMVWPTSFLGRIIWNTIVKEVTERLCSTAMNFRFASPSRLRSCGQQESFGKVTMVSLRK